MDRRKFLTNGLAFLAALEPSKIGASPIQDSSLREEVRGKDTISRYKIKKGVLLWGEQEPGTPGCVFENLSFTVTSRVTPANVQGRIEFILGPQAVMQESFKRFERPNTFKFCVTCENSTHLWFMLSKVLLRALGPSVLASGMLLVQGVEFISTGEPELLCAPDSTLEVLT